MSMLVQWHDGVSVVLCPSMMSWYDGMVQCSGICKLKSVSLTLDRVCFIDRQKLV